MWDVLAGGRHSCEGPRTEEVKAALPAALQGWLLKLQIMLLHITNSLLGCCFFLLSAMHLSLLRCPRCCPGNADKCGPSVDSFSSILGQAWKLFAKDWKFKTFSLTQNSEIANIGIPDRAHNRTLDPYLQEKPQTLTRVNNRTVQKTLPTIRFSFSHNSEMLI